MAVETKEAETEFGSRQQARAELRRLRKIVKRSKAAKERYRSRCEEGVEFYFGRQWKEEDRQTLEDRGQPVITVNRVKPTVRLIHGLMVSQPMDWLVKPVGKNDDALAETGTAALKYVADQNNVDHITSMVFFWALTYGVGWVRTGLHIRDRDPRTEPVQVDWVSSDEILTDPMSKDLAYRDGRWLVWRRTVDLDDAISEFPKAAKTLTEQSRIGKDSETDTEATWVVSDMGTPPVSDWDTLQDWNQADKEDYNGETRQVALYEVWERVPVETDVAEHKDGWVHEVDLKNPDDVAMLQAPDVVRFYKAKITKVRYTVFCGDMILKQEWSPYKHDRIPFIPCWHERDENGDPVSFVEAIKDMQREINHRRSKALHEMSNPNMRFSRRVLEAMHLDEAQARERWFQGGHVWIADPGEIEILANPAVSSGQIELMQDSKAEIQASSGANDDLMGYDSSSKSGVAKQTQIEQGQTMQRPSEHNLKLFRKLLGEQLLMLIRQAHTTEWIIRITDDVGKDKYITVNEPSIDPQTGQHVVLNDLTNLNAEVVIDNQPWTPTLRQRAAEFLMNMANAEADPFIRSKLQVMAIKASDIPEKASILDLYGEAEQMMMANVQAQQQGEQGAQPQSPVSPISIAYKDLPPDVQRQVEAGLGFQPSMVGGVSSPELKAQEQQHATVMKVADQSHQAQQTAVSHAMKADQMAMQHDQSKDMAMLGHGNQLEMQERQAQTQPQGEVV